MPSPGNTAISLGSPKESALYFDHVFPLDFGFPVISSALARMGKTGPLVDWGNLEIPVKGSGFDQDVLTSLLPKDCGAEQAYNDLYIVAACFWFMPFLSAAERMVEGFEWIGREDARKVFERAGFNFDQVLAIARSQNSFDLTEFVSQNVKKYESILSRAGLGSAPTWAGHFAFAAEPLGGGGEASFDYAIALHDLELIDPLELTWEQVVEFRKDPTSLTALRDFRLFFSESFAGKDSVFVQDKLLSLLNDYEVTSKFWGFETARKTLAVAVSQHNVTSTAIGTLASALAGAPVGIVAATGAVITLGSCVLEFGQSFVDSRKAELVRPLRYLSKLKSIAVE